MLDINILKQRYDEEIRDYEEYKALAKTADEGFSCMLYDIAMEEKEHAEHLQWIMSRM